MPRHHAVTKTTSRSSSNGKHADACTRVLCCTRVFTTVGWGAVPLCLVVLPERLYRFARH